MSEKCSSCGRSDVVFNKGQRWCRNCQRDYMRVWRKENRAKLREDHRGWKAANPDKVYHYPNNLEVKAAWRANNPDKVKKAYRDWYYAHQEQEKHRRAVRRARYKDETATLTLSEWLATWDEFEGKCFWCGLDATDMEHIVPLTPRPGQQQGYHTNSNCVPSCQPCNSRKWNKDPLVFLFEMRKNGEMQSM